jgi:hypothetical protein
MSDCRGPSRQFPITFFATLMLRRRLVPVVAIFGGRTQR